MRMKVNLGSGAFFMLISTVLWFSVPSQIKTVETSSINARTFPRLIIAIMFACGLALCVKDAAALLRKRSVEETSFLLRPELRVLLLAAMLVAYAFILPYAGYLLASALLCVGMLIFYKTKRLKYHLIVLSICVAASFFYKDFLSIKLP